MVSLCSFLAAALAACSLVNVEAFSSSGHSFQHRSRSAAARELPATSLAASASDDDKFSFAQRIESVKCAVVGAVAGGIALAPVAAFHDILYSDPMTTNGVAQWEFDTDMGSLEGALFAIVYRYVIREDENDMLNMGALGAFVFVRTISRINTPTYCTAAPLSCGDPLGYFSWDMINQGLLSGAESVALFGGAALAMDYCFKKGYISKFR